MMRMVRGMSVAFLVAFGIFVLGARFSMAQGDAQAGKVFWDDARCQRCHGEKGEGGFGPDLAGRQLTLAQFKQAIRKPWGVMLAFDESQFSDQEVANVYTYLQSLPKVSAPGPWRTPQQSGASYGERLAVSYGCAQCHGRTIDGPRRDLGKMNADYAFFKRLVYEHTTAMPEMRKVLKEEPAKNRMGNFNPDRLPEALLQEIWKYLNDLGLKG